VFPDTAADAGLTLVVVGPDEVEDPQAVSPAKTSAAPASTTGACLKNLETRMQQSGEKWSAQGSWPTQVNS
jgi:hypothetical protein